MIDRSTNIRGALRQRQRGFIINPYRFGAGAPPPASGYDALMAALAPDLWWKLEETAGTSVADSSGNGYGGTIASGNLSTGTVAPESGHAGIGRGINMNAIGQTLSSGSTPLVLGAAGAPGGSAGTWAISIWCKPLNSTADQYVFFRGNPCAVIYGYVNGAFEFFSNAPNGPDPRIGSQLAAAAGSVHHVVYRYVAGQWSGFLNGTKVFDVARSFAPSGGTTAQWFASNTFQGPMLDLALFMGHAPSDAEIAALYAARA